MAKHIEIDNNTEIICAAERAKAVADMLTVLMEEEGWVRTVRNATPVNAVYSIIHELKAIEKLAGGES